MIDTPAERSLQAVASSGSPHRASPSRTNGSSTTAWVGDVTGSSERCRSDEPGVRQAMQDQAFSPGKKSASYGKYSIVVSSALHFS